MPLRSTLLLGLMLVGLTSCGGGQTASACETALAAAASTDEMHDSVEDLYAGVRACSTVEEWEAAWSTHGADLGFVGSATAVLRNVCLAPEVSDEPLCQAVDG